MSSRRRPDGRGRPPQFKADAAQGAAVSQWSMAERADALDPGGPVWTEWRKCPQCFAEIGEPCVDLSGYSAKGVGMTISQILDHPHSLRERRRPGGASPTPQGPVA